MASKSIMQDEKVCFLTNSTQNLHRHHIFGGANRDNSEKYGLWIYLTADMHNMSNKGIHFNRELAITIKQLGQKEFEKTHTREEFMRIFGKNYL